MAYTERLWIERKKGPRLAASLDLPAGEPHGFLILAHCFTCTKNTKVLTRMAHVLAGRGWGALRFDFAGLGNSEGHFIETNLTTNIADVVAAHDYIRHHYGPVGLLAGHSLGGAAALLAARQLPSVVAVVTLATASRPTYLTERLGEGAARAMAAGEAEVDVYGRAFRLRRQLFDDLARHDLEAAVAGLGRPLLILQPGADEIVDGSHAETLFAWARPPKKLVVLEGAGHLLDRPEDARRAAEEIAAWADAWIPRPAPG